MVDTDVTHVTQPLQAPGADPEQPPVSSTGRVGTSTQASNQHAQARHHLMRELDNSLPAGRAQLSRLISLVCVQHPTRIDLFIRDIVWAVWGLACSMTDVLSSLAGSAKRLQFLKTVPLLTYTTGTAAPAASANSTAAATADMRHLAAATLEVRSLPHAGLLQYGCWCVHPVHVCLLLTMRAWCVTSARCQR